MSADWIAGLEPWWPILAAAAVGLLLGWLLRGRRAPSRPDAAAETRLQTERDTPASASQAALDEPIPFPAHPPVTAMPAAVMPAAAMPVAAIRGDAITDVVPGVAPKADVTQAFTQFESKLREWQTYASSEAVQTVDQPSIDDWDDLMDIDGIDLDLARFLYAEGLHTFDQVAAMTTAQLRDVLDRAGSAHADVDPASWPESARRAALAR